MANSRMKLMLFCAVLVLAFALPAVSVCPRGDDINPGTNLWTCPNSNFVFGGPGCVPAIPADFFGPGSDPFEGQVACVGHGQNPYIDAVIERKTQGSVPEPHPTSDTIDIELVELHLRSIAPIIVTYNGGQDPEQWDVDVDVSPGTSSLGTLEATKTHCNGGTYTAGLNVQPRFIFTMVGNPSQTREWDTGLEGITLPDLDGGPCPWDNTPECNDFRPSVSCALTLQETGGCYITLIPSEMVRDTFWVRVGSSGEATGGCTGYGDGAWYYYENMDWWNQWFYDHPLDRTRKKVIDISFTIQPLDPGQGSWAVIAYNWATPQWPDPENPPLPPLSPEDEDLYIGRHIFYQGDLAQWPELVVDHFEIEAYNPEWISIDITGFNFEIVDDADGLGIGIIDHACIEKDYPPYVPKPPVANLKWSQPPIEIDPNLDVPLYCGWDELSWAEDPDSLWQIVADDFRCFGNMPVTSIHWWGSYINWMEAEPPVDGNDPVAWRIGFWSNIPEGTMVYSADPSLTIPDWDAASGPGVVSHTINVPNSFTIHDVDIDVIIDHTWLWDLKIEVEHLGVIVTLWDQACGSEDNMDVIFDDEGNPVFCASPTVGNITPTSAWGTALSAFDGMDSSGDWKITVTDNAAPDTGTLEHWSVHFYSPSRPETLLHQTEVDADRVNIDWVGVDAHPDFPLDTCFQYYVDLVDIEWFWQGDFELYTIDNVFWLSIAAIYPPDTGVLYPWGWKTRPWSWMDDAVKFELVDVNPSVDPGDPMSGTVIDSTAVTPLEDPMTGESVDVSFELDTDPGYVKWEQSFTGIRNWPHYEDELSMAIFEAPPKWQQDPNVNLSGLHAHDSGDISQQWTTLADDWHCNGGPVTDIHWWGNYETNASGAEIRGSGISYFHLSIHDPDPQNPCLPGLEVWGQDVQFAALIEQNTGLVNNMGEVIYLYEFDLTDPFDQIEDSNYFLDITAFSNDWGDPALWRWQESSRSPNPTLCSAVSRTGPIGTWSPLEWPGDPDIYSDMAFVITSDGEPELNIHALVADDWLCEKKTPITAAAWWGSYIGYQYEACQDQPTERPNKPDYFYLSIWTDVAADDADNQYQFSHPGVKIWDYNSYDYDEVLVGYDKHPEDEEGPPREAVFRYSVGIPEDEQFCQEEPDTVYWFSVVAVYDGSDPIYDWGWTNHAHVYNDDAVAGYLDPDLGWTWQELYDQTGESEDMSFMLFTDPEECCPCLGDVDGSGSVNFSDLMLIYTEMINQYPNGDPTFIYEIGNPVGLPCGDVDDSGSINFSDLMLIYTEMINQYPNGDPTFVYEIGCPF